MNSQIIDSLEQVLKYHNFNPIRPIKINGQVTDKTSIVEEDIIFSKDIKLLEDCKIMIAVLTLLQLVILLYCFKQFQLKE